MLRCRAVDATGMTAAGAAEQPVYSLALILISNNNNNCPGAA